MERFFTPLATDLPEARQVLVLAPHADDEVFGCGGLLARLAEQGAAIRVLVLTQPEDARLAAKRRGESRQAARLLGYPEPAFLDARDGALASTPIAVLMEQLQTWLTESPPDLVLAPSPWEMHRDHRRLCEVAIGLCCEHRLAAKARLAFYEVGQPLTPNLLVDISTVAARKTEAMAVFVTQHARQNYGRQVAALNVYRTYSLADAVAAEAFLLVPMAEVAALREVLEPERLSAVVWQAEREVAGFRAEQARLEQDNQALLNSYSWRVTAPLRNIARGLRVLAQRLPVRVRRHPIGLYHWLEHQAQNWVVSAGQVSGWQALLERRLDANEMPASGWRSVCVGPDPEPWPGVTISIVTFNSARWLPGLLDSLLVQHYPLRRLSLVFVDNGSQDDTLARLHAFRDRHGAAFASITLHQLDNPGFGAAHNDALAQVSDDWVLIANPDLEFAPETLPRVVRMALADHPKVASWELRQAPYEHPKHYDPVSWETLWSSHACILLRSSVFAALGGYDERLFLYGEDVEFSFRCREAGYQLRYCPLAQVHHYTYAEAHELKPAQYLGSTRANLFLRLRYGTARDAAASLLLAGTSLLRRPFPSARRRLLVAFHHLLWQAPGLWRENRAGRERGVGVFRRFDYEMIRTGAFEPAPILPAASALPLVSVITRTFQGRDWLLRQAGLSVLQQTWPNLEWIVVEDGGETCRATVDALAAAAPFPVRFLSQSKHGRSCAGNLGLEASRGRWCVFLDDDDLLYADHVETLAGALLAAPELAAAYALAWDVHCDVDPVKQTIQEQAYVQHAAHVQPFDLDELSWRNYIPIQAILFERRLYEERGGFREHFDQLEDWNLWRRYVQGERFLLVNKTTSLYRTPAHVEHSGRRQALLDQAYAQVKRETDAELTSIASRAG